MTFVARAYYTVVVVIVVALIIVSAGTLCAPIGLAAIDSALIFSSDDRHPVGEFIAAEM